MNDDETVGSFRSECLLARSMTEHFCVWLGSLFWLNECGPCAFFFFLKDQIDWFLLIQPFIMPYLMFLISVHSLRD